MKTIKVGDLINVKKSRFTPHLKHVMKVYGVKVKRCRHKVVKITPCALYGEKVNYTIDNGRMLLWGSEVEGVD